MVLVKRMTTKNYAIYYTRVVPAVLVTCMNNITTVGESELLFPISVTCDDCRFIKYTVYNLKKDSLRPG